MYVSILVLYRLVTDERTDGKTDMQTHDDSIYRASIASRGKTGSLTYRIRQTTPTVVQGLWFSGAKDFHNIRMGPL